MKRRILAGLLSLVMVMSLLPGAALAAEETAEPGVGTEETVEPTVPEVPTEPEKPVEPETPTEPEEPEIPWTDLTPAEPVEDEAAAAEEQLAELIAALPDPADIDPEDEAQVEAVNGQIAEIYAFAEENGLDVENDETINAVIAALYPVELLENSITENGGELVSGTYVLNEDVKLKSGLTIPENEEVTIDLRGNILTAPDNQSVFTVQGALTLIDSNSSTPHTGYLDNAGLWNADTGERDSITLNGGIITGARVTDYTPSVSGAPGGCGGGVYVLPTGTFVMEGGTIAGCQVSNNGGAVYCYSGGTFTMNGGALSYNIAYNQGGAVMVGGKSEMTMTDGEISHNICRAGGGVIVNNEFTMTGGKIIHNTATFPEGSTAKPNTIFGGGVAVNGGTFTFSNGEISGNQAISKTANDKEYPATGAGVSAGGTMIVSKTVTIKDNTCGDTANNVYLPSGRVITVDNLDSQSKIGVTLADGHGCVTEGYQNNVGVFFSDCGDNDKLIVRDGELWYNLDDMTTTNPDEAVVKIGDLMYKNFDDAWAYGTSHDITIEILKDLTIEKEYTVPTNGSIKLTAKTPVTLTCQKLSSTTRGYFQVLSGRALEIDGHITISGGTGDTAADGRAVYVNGGTFHLSNGATISNFNVKNNNGAAIYAYNSTSTVVIDGGCITGNAGENGGGMYLESGETTITNGRIENNTATVDGGGIYNAAASKLEIVGGSISLNRVVSPDAGTVSAVNGGGIYNLGTVTMQSGEIKQNQVIVNVEAYGLGRGGGIYNSGKFTMYDGAISQNSCVQGVAITSHSTLMGAGLCNEENATIHGGTISGNYYKAHEDSSETELNFLDGVGVANNGATLTIHGGEIRGNYAVQDGSTEHIDVQGAGVSSTSNTMYSASFTMTGGIIAGNDGQGQSGAGLYLGGSDSRKSTAVISGGEITDNTGRDGVRVDVYTTLSMSGNPVIQNNHQQDGISERNVYLVKKDENQAKVTLTGELTSGADIGVTMQNHAENVVVAEGTDRYAVTGHDAGFFTYDVSSDNLLIVKAENQNALVLHKHEIGKTYYTVTLTLPEHVSADIAHTHEVEEGTPYEVTFTVDEGYEIDSVTANGTAVTLGENNKVTLENVTADTEITVTVTEKKVTIEPEEINVTGTYGTKLEYQINVNASYISRNSIIQSYALAQGNELPEGLTLSNTGLISGTPAEAGEWANGKAVSVVVTAKNGQTATITLNVKINKATPTISITADKSSIVGGGTVELTVNVVPADSTVTVTQTDDQGSAAKTLTLTNGKVSVALDNKDAKYTFTASCAETNNYSAGSSTCTVTVSLRKPPVTGITLDKTALTLYVDEEEKLTATVTPVDTTDTVTWSSDNEKVATVDENGIVTAHRRGKATITATAGTVSASCQVEVIRRPSSSGGDHDDPDYAVTVDKDMENGTVTVSPKRAEKGDTVTITVRPDKGYELDELIVTDSKGNELDLREKGDNKFTFKMPGSRVIVEATFRAVEENPEKPQLVNPFVDVNENAYYHDAVLWAVEKGITGGTTAATFSPDDACTRAQMVTFLWRAAGSPVVNYAMSFTDVPADAYYAEAVRWAVSQGITAGTSATTFSPNATVTRGQTVTFLWRAAGSPVVAGDSFADVAADAYYAPAVAWAVREGITSGVGAETFAPSADCTRGQIVTFLYRDMAK